MPTKGPSNDYERLTTAELARMASKFDSEFVVDESTPLNAQQRSRWNRAKRDHDGPKTSVSSTTISVSLAPGLRAKVERYAKARRISLAKLIRSALAAIVDEPRDGPDKPKRTRRAS